MNLIPLQLLDCLLVAVALVFLFSALILQAVQWKLAIRTLSFNIGLCWAGFLYCLMMGSSQFDPNIGQTRVLQHIVWVSGCFYLYFLIGAIEQFLKTGSRIIRASKAVALLAAFFSLGLALFYFTTGRMLLYSEGSLALNSVFLTETEKHSFAPNIITLLLGATLFLNQLTAMVVFLKKMVLQKQDKLLIFTTAFGLLSVLYEIFLAVSPFKYGVSILFLSGLFESFRLAYLSIRKTLYNQRVLQRSASDAQLLVRALGVGIWRWDIVSNHLEWNYNAYQMFGIQPSEFSATYEAWEATLHPDDKERVQKELKGALYEKKPYDTFFRITLPSGESRHIGARGVVEYDSNDKPIRMTGVNWDASDVIRERFKNVELHMQLDSITKNIPGIVFQLKQSPQKAISMPFVVGDGLSMLEVSQSAYEKDHEAVLRLIHPEDRARFRQSLDKSADELSRTNWTGRLITPSGKLRWGYLLAMPRRESDGSVLWNGVLMDVTKEKELEEQVNFERGKAIQNAKLASLGEMSAGIAHEINNPLMIIHGNLGLVQKHSGDQDKVGERVETIKKSVERIAKIVNGLRKFSRSSQTEKYIEKDLSEIIAESLLLTSNKAKRANVAITVDQRIPGKILCNEIEIEQVLINLINNAIDAAKDSSDRWVKLSVHDGGNQTVLRISDSGNGIPPQFRDRLFEPFFTTKPQGEGTGLGLSISKGILDQHQATIAVLPDEPHTCFEIRFKRSFEARYAAQDSLPR